MNWTQKQIDDTLRAVVERSMTDADYRALAVKDAAAAIAKITSEPIGDIKVRFVDSTGYDMTVVLPAPAAAAAGELRDEELAGVAGGTIAGTIGVGPSSLACATLLCAPNTTYCAYTRKPNSPAFCPK